MSRTGLAVSAMAAAAGLGLLASCGYGTDDIGAPAPAAVQQQAQPAEQAKLVAAEVGELGQVLTDQDGKTLYRFAEDSADPPTATCEGDCATAWPPLLAEGEVAAEGLDQSLVGTVSRSDGTQQVTVNGWPVYRFAKDTAPGQAQGQGADDAWSAITPAGGKAGEGAAAVNTTEIAGLGEVLVDQDGMTLYLFKEDSTEPPEATCEGDCAQTWPPLLAEGDVQIDGVDPALVSTVERADGTRQVTVGNWPVYRYAKDTAPGDATGHGVKGTWYAMEPAGCAVSPEKKPAEAAGEEADSGYDY
ncbi:SCO0930 family lipoprotein [Qaidamihabitans albus]|uniref:SCO0930 family lipoprotein n=1 Tax=Qaidamihabitans albus TaxID=2795733 RepID=UPI0018F2110A|nr:SCO0930 family lipoprotein [Qaidamihabitans albus]